MCGALGVSWGGFYAWLTRPRSRHSRRDEELSAKVRASFIGSDRTYGARRVWRDLAAAYFVPPLPFFSRPLPKLGRLLILFVHPVQQFNNFRCVPRLNSVDP